MSFKSLLNSIKSRPVEVVNATILHEGEQIPYIVRFSSRRKTVSICVYKSDRRVEIKAPQGYSLRKVEQFAISKIDWIVKNIKAIDLRDIQLPALDYSDGSKHLLLGEQYTLKIELGRRANVQILGDTIVLKAMREQSVEKVLRRWYLLKAIEIIPEIISKEVYSFHTRYHKSPITIEYKMVKSYWGVCTSGMIIRLNGELVRAREEHIRYIMSHELCHLIHRNHSSRFYALLDEVCPNWRELKKELNALVRLR